MALVVLVSGDVDAVGRGPVLGAAVVGREVPVGHALEGEEVMASAVRVVTR